MTRRSFTDDTYNGKKGLVKMIKRFVSVFLIAILCFAPVSAYSTETGNSVTDDTVSAEIETVQQETAEAAEPELVLQAPTGVKAAGKDYNKIKISWKKVENADGYKVYRWSKKQKKYLCIETVKGSKKTSYTDSGLSIKSRYCYKVAAYARTDDKTIKSKKSKKAVGWTLKSYRGISLVKPLKKSTHVSGYGMRGGAFHIGADYAAPKGTPVYAAASGTVIKSKSNYGGLGEGIVIKHAKGLVTWYGHLNSRSVRAGQKVKAGDKIGTVGSTGNATSNHLHFEVWINGRTYNPQKFF